MAVSENAVWQGDGYVNGKRFRNVEIRNGKMYYKNREVASHWVRFNREYSDGYGSYQKGQEVEIRSLEKLALYLEEGYCEPCEPQDPTPRDKFAEGPTGTFRCIVSMASVNGSFEVGRDYMLPLARGKKYVERGIMLELDRPEVRQAPDRKRN